MFSYTAIVGSGDGGRAGSWYTDAGTCVGIVRGKRIVEGMAMRKAMTRVGGWKEGVATHRENCAQGEASVLVLAAIRVTMGHISFLLYDTRRVSSCRVVPYC